MSGSDLSVTALLREYDRGEPEAFDRLVGLLYDHLRRLAHAERSRRGAKGSWDATLATTALVHEAYLKLFDQDGASWRDRGHFFAAAAQAMRHLLVDAARRRLAAKRGSGEADATLDEQWLPAREHAAEVIAVHDALEALSALGGRLRAVVECRFFAGLTEEETAAALGVSVRTVHRDWLRAKGWLRRQLGTVPAQDGAAAGRGRTSPAKDRSNRREDDRRGAPDE
jgi:RNA polymerase sigma factor (TIGR02999 family)